MPAWTEKGHVKMTDIAIFTQVQAELDRAREKFPVGFHNAHEGYAVLLEEVDELWTEIKHGRLRRLARREAIQVAAMAIRLIADVYDKDPPNG